MTNIRYSSTNTNVLLFKSFSVFVLCVKVSLNVVVAILQDV